MAMRVPPRGLNWPIYTYAKGVGPLASVPVCDPTIEGTCMREPALTMRTRTVLGAVPAASVDAGLAANNELLACVLSNPTPLIR